MLTYQSTSPTIRNGRLRGASPTCGFRFPSPEIRNGRRWVAPMIRNGRRGIACPEIRNGRWAH